MTTPINPFHAGRSFSLVTKQNVSVRSAIPAQAFPEGSTLVAEFDETSRFLNPTEAGVVDYLDGQFVLQLTPFEVNTIRSGFFRIVAVMGNVKRFSAAGKITFVPSDSPLVVDDSEVVTAEQLSTVSFTGDYNDLVNRPVSIPGADVDEKVSAAVDGHIASTSPHPVYDDLPSLNLLFENGLI